MEKWSREEIEDVDGLTFSKQDIHEHLKYLDIREDDYSHGVSAEIIRHLLQQLEEAEKRVAGECAKTARTANPLRIDKAFIEGQIAAADAIRQKYGIGG